MDKSLKINTLVINFDQTRLRARQFKNSWFVKEKWDLIDCDNNPDLVVIYSCDLRYKSALKKILQKRIQYGFKPFFLVLTGESTDFYFIGVDFSISHKPDTNINYYVPLLTYSQNVLRAPLNNTSDNTANNRSNPKPYFCNFIYSNTGKSQYLFDTKQRDRFCQLLSKYKMVDCAGKALNNTDRLKVIEETTGKNNAAKIKFMQDYKFSITFENQSAMGYITEKIWVAYLAGTIPIYWGAPNINQYFNPQSFINCHDYNSFEEVIDRIREIDNNPALFKQYLNAPPILDNSQLYDFTKQKISARIDTIMNEVVRKRESLRSDKYPRLYELYGFLGFITKVPIAMLSALIRRITRFKSNIKKEVIRF